MDTMQCSSPNEYQFRGHATRRLTLPGDRLQQAISGYTAFWFRAPLQSPSVERSKASHVESVSVSLLLSSKAGMAPWRIVSARARRASRATAISWIFFRVLFMDPLTFDCSVSGISGTTSIESGFSLSELGALLLDGVAIDPPPLVGVPSGERGGKTRGGGEAAPAPPEGVMSGEERGRGGKAADAPPAGVLSGEERGARTRGTTCANTGRLPGALPLGGVPIHEPGHGGVLLGARNEAPRAPTFEPFTVVQRRCLFAARGDRVAPAAAPRDSDARRWHATVCSSLFGAKHGARGPKEHVSPRCSGSDSCVAQAGSAPLTHSVDINMFWSSLTACSLTRFSALILLHAKYLHFKQGSSAIDATPEQMASQVVAMLHVSQFFKDTFSDISSDASNFVWITFGTSAPRAKPAMAMRNFSSGVVEVSLARSSDLSRLLARNLHLRSVSNRAHPMSPLPFGIRVG